MPSEGFSQILHVYDADNHKPIAYAHLIHIKSGLTNGGTYTNEEGLAELSDDFKKNDTLHISCLGYDRVIKILGSYHDTVFLEPTQEMLEPVHISFDQNSPLIYYGTDKGLKTQSQRAYPGFKQIILISNPAKEIKKIEQFYFELSKVRTKGNYLVRVVFYENVNGRPANKIANERVLEITRKRGKEVLVDLDSNNLFLPMDGLFVGLEWIGSFSTEDKERNELAIKITRQCPGGSNCLGKVFHSLPNNTSKFIDSNEGIPLEFRYLPVFGVMVRS